MRNKRIIIKINVSQEESSKNLRKKSFLFWFYFLLHRLLFLLVLRVARQLIRPLIPLLGLLKVTQLLLTISQPCIRDGLFLVQLNGLQEALLGLLVILKSEVGRSLVVVVNCVFGLKFYCLVMLFDCILVLLYFVVSSAKVAVVCWDFGLDFNGLFSELDLLVILLHLA